MCQLLRVGEATFVSDFWYIVNLEMIISQRHVAAGQQRLDNAGALPTSHRQDHSQSPSWLGNFRRLERRRVLLTPPPLHLWHTLSLAMQELPHGLPLTQCGFLGSAVEPLRQELMNCLRASPLMALACVLQSFILCCWEL